jgi:hypothetical protein
VGGHEKPRLRGGPTFAKNLLPRVWGSTRIDLIGSNGAAVIFG